jgi:hypothetical protein
MGYDTGECIACYCGRSGGNSNADENCTENICFGCFHEEFVHATCRVGNSLNNERRIATNEKCWHCGDTRSFLITTELCKEHWEYLKYEGEDSDEGDDEDDDED